MSLWDADSAEALQAWLDSDLAASEPGLVSTVHEVQEEFSYGIQFDLAQKRAAEKVAAGSRTAIGALSKGASEAGDQMWKQVRCSIEHEMNMSYDKLKHFHFSLMSCSWKRSTRRLIS